MIYGVVLTKKYEKLEQKFVEENYLVYLSSIHNNFQIWLNTGGSLDKTPNIANMIDALSVQLVDVQTIDIINNEGITIYSTDTSFINEKIPEEWLAKIKYEITPKFSNNTTNYVGITLKDDTGNFAGVLLASYPQNIYNGKIMEITYKITIFLMIIIIFIVMLSFYFSNNFFAGAIQRINKQANSFYLLNNKKLNREYHEFNEETNKKLEAHEIFMKDRRNKMLAIDFADNSS